MAKNEKSGRPAGRKRPRLKRLANFLLTCRGKCGFSSQDEVAKALTERGTPVSQSLLAKYESGQVVDPAHDVLHSLAKLYDVDYLQLVLEVVREKYDPSGELFGDDASRLKMALIDQILSETDDLIFLRSRLAQFKLGRVLDVPAMATWQAGLEDGATFWVIAPDFLDDENQDIFESVWQNLTRGVKYRYFIYPWKLDRFVGLAARLRDRIGRKCKSRFGDLFQAYFLPQSDEGDFDFVNVWLGTYYMVANPDRFEMAQAFQCIRQNGRSALAVEMIKRDTHDLIREWKKLVTIENKANTPE